MLTYNPTINPHKSNTPSQEYINEQTILIDALRKDSIVLNKTVETQGDLLNLAQDRIKGLEEILFKKKDIGEGAEEEYPILTASELAWEHGKEVLQDHDSPIAEKDPTITRDPTINNGGKTGYYDIPEDVVTLSDLIEHKGMNHAVGEAFAAIYRLYNKDSPIRNLNKAIHFLQRQLEIEKGDSTLEPITLKDMESKPTGDNLTKQAEQETPFIPTGRPFIL